MVYHKFAKHLAFFLALAFFGAWNFGGFVAGQDLITSNIFDHSWF